MSCYIKVRGRVVDSWGQTFPLLSQFCGITVIQLSLILDGAD